jgi:Xaa-Pro dipeptidase
MAFDEPARLARLLAAQDRAKALFEAIAATGLIRAGATEQGLSEEIHALAAERFGLQAHWHKRVVRSGPHTLLGYPEDPPDRTIEAEDILFVDLGPVFDDYEADLGRTFVLGADPQRLRLAADLPAVFDELKAEYEACPDMTGAQLYARAHAAAKRRGWVFGGAIAGHLVGEFPHSGFPGDRAVSYIAAGNDLRMREPDADGRRRYWILEVHLVDPERGFGGFCEELLSARA